MYIGSLLVQNTSIDIFIITMLNFYDIMTSLVFRDLDILCVFRVMYIFAYDIFDISLVNSCIFILRFYIYNHMKKKNLHDVGEIFVQGTNFQPCQCK